MRWLLAAVLLAGCAGPQPQGPLAMEVDVDRPALAAGDIRGTLTFANPGPEPVWLIPFHACTSDVVVLRDGVAIAPTSANACDFSAHYRDEHLVQVPAGGTAGLPFAGRNPYDLEPGVSYLVVVTYRADRPGAERVTLPFWEGILVGNQTVVA